MAFTAQAFTYTMHLLNKCFSNEPVAAIQWFYACLIILHAPTYLRCSVPAEKFWLVLFCLFLETFIAFLESQNKGISEIKYIDGSFHNHFIN